jgi:hypothetical protein
MYGDRETGNMQGWGGSQGMHGGGQGMQGWGGQMRQGRGPKGYKRSDERIREDICDRLTDHHDIDASEVEVKVQNGEVTLTGTVTDRRHKHMIEHIVESMSGVQDVHNQIRLKREESSTQQASGSHQTSGSMTSSVSSGHADKNGTAQETSKSQLGSRI